MPSLHERLLQALGPRDDLAWLVDPAQAALLVEARNEAHARWPSLAVPEATFARRVASVVEVASPALGSLAELRPTEQFLVTACLSRLPGAVEALEAHAFGLVAAVSSQFSGVLSRDEFVQDVRSRLLTSATDAAPRLALFTGLTSLERWIRIMAVRVGLDTVRSAQRRQTRERALPDVLPQRDPELYWMRQLYTENFERILLRSLSTLPARDRNVLRAQVVHGMSLDEMARVWAVHRATIARWLQAARTGLLVSVREGLQLEAGLSESEVDSVINLIRSGVSEGVIVRGLRSGAG